MAKIFEVRPENRPVVIILFIGLIADFFIGTIPSLQTAAFLYGFLILIGLFCYTNPVLQRYVIGIPKKGLFLSIFFGILAGFGILIMPKFGLSIGVPLLPASVESDLKWVVICIFAPFFEEITTRGALLGFVRYLASKGRNPSTAVTLVAIFLQAIFFMIIHFTAYSQGWYSAPDFTSAASQLGAVMASLIAAGVFGLIMGFFVTRKGINSLAFSIAAHYLVNQIVFVQIYSIFV